jgi:hypothetical protein
MSAAASWAAPAARRRGLSAPEWFLVLEMGCQLALLAPALNGGPMRVAWRVGGFAASLLLLAGLRGRTRANAVNVAALWVIGLFLVEMLNPMSNTWISRLAVVGMAVASLAPLFWMTRLRFPEGLFERILRLFWAYYTLGAGVGLLQVYFPGRFQPQLSPVVLGLGQDVEGLKITLANGVHMFRPMGLTDTPGGAATAGLWAVLFGLGFLLTVRPSHHAWAQKLIYLGSMIAGMMIIYLSQQRALLVVVAIWFAALLAILLWRQRWRESALLAGLVVVLALGSFRVAAGVGGRDMIQRVTSLGGGQGEQLYRQERGTFLAQAFGDFLHQYPLGAGLGRWGMMNQYFGDPTRAQSGTLYVEIQWQAWVLDGGAPMLAAYLLLLLLTAWSLFRLARQRQRLWLWAALCLAYDVGVLALTFDYTPFTGQMGLEFWFLNALVLAAVAASGREPRRAAAGGER